MRMMPHQIENIDEKIEIVKENKLDILEWQVK